MFKFEDMKSKVISFLIFVAIFIIFFCWMDKRKNDEINLIKKSHGLATGVVIKKTSYKGKHITVKYLVGGQEFIESDGYDAGDKVEIGDSIIINYYTEDPSVMITEFNDAFKNIK